jgi:cyclopropane-fatty-acyl-phospholipid synthase
MLAKRIADHFLSSLDRLECGSLELVTPDGKSRSFEGKNPGVSTKLHLHEWSVLSNMAAKGDIGLAEDYRAGLWETSNLEDLLTLGLQNEQIISRYVFGSPISKIKNRLSYFLNKNTIKGSKKNIHAHYDLGNEFYKLWLDPTMTYSSGLFVTPQESLEKGQLNKYDRILDILEADQGDLLEIGCGWGGFAERAASRSALSLKGITLSEEQHLYATQRLGNKADIVIEDYRDQKGLFDYIVSIEMFEAVGEEYWPVYFKKVASLLKKNGKAVIQTITIHDNLFKKYREGGDAIRSFIFPGGMLPSPSRFKEEATKAGLKASNQFDFGLDYALTLQRWLKAFDDKKSQILAMGFDEGFIRLWRFYLASCIAGFRTGRANVMQIELTHA